MLSVHYLTFATLFDHVLPVYTCDMCYFVWSLLIIILFNHYWLKDFAKNKNSLHCEGFFLKTKFISAFMIVVNRRYFSSIYCCFVYWRFHWTCLWCISALKEEKIRTRCNLFIYSFFFKCYCFCLKWIKAKPYSASKVKPPFLEFLGLF